MHTVPVGLLGRLWAQAARFATVGLVNTLVDFAAFNGLLALYRPEGAAGMAAIAAVAALLATLNSYVLNSRWTFRDGVAGERSPLRFAVIAALGIAVQAGVAMFVAHKLLADVALPPLVAANCAKLAAVAAAVIVTFAGYRIAVFTPPSLRRFRETVSLLPSGAPPSAAALSAVAAIALLARLAFWHLAPVAYGDAVSYSWVAWALGHGNAGQADAFWHSLFDYWQAGLVASGLPQYPAMVLSSLIPGVLVTVPVMLLASRLYGNTVALVAGLATALHPRLVEYSVNGYAESFFLLAAVWGVLGVTILIDAPRRWWAAIVGGTGLAAWVLVRNESLPVALALLALPLMAPAGPRLRRLPGLVVALVAAAVVTGATLAADVQLFGQPQLFAKAANASRVHVEMLDPEAAARETYGGRVPASTGSAPSVTERITVLVERWPRNIAYTLERLPGMLLSPLFLAALLLPALVRRRAGRATEWPLMLFTTWPLLFYPLLQLEPRMLFPLVIGAGVFGAAGLVALGRFLAGHLGWQPMRSLPAAATVALLVVTSVPLALRSESERGPHRAVGAWLAANVPQSVAVSGDGYGYASASAFWSGRRVHPRPWSESGEELGRWLDARSPSVMLVYDGFRREFNPGLALARDGSEPGMTRIAILPFCGGDSVEVWANDDAVAEISRMRVPDGPVRDRQQQLATAR
jgi:putative flippase GtrA